MKLSISNGICCFIGLALGGLTIYFNTSAPKGFAQAFVSGGFIGIGVVYLNAWLETWREGS